MKLHQLSPLAAAAVALMVACAPAQAGIITFTGNTSAGASYNRLVEDLSAPSGLGTAVKYSLFTFTVSAPGDYTFVTTTVTYDPFVFLYSPSFAPASPLTNALIGNDDLLGFTTSGFSWTLAAGTSYTFVNTGFANTDFGVFSTTIGGPGNVIPAVIPEPSPYAMLALGVVAIGLVRQRRITSST
jgi:hypothetical protein